MAKHEDPSAMEQLSAAGNEAIDLINRVDDATAKFQPSKRRGSIIKAAKGNIFEFPVFISSSIPLDYATATVSLLEQIYAAYLQMAISINPVVDAQTIKNGLQFANYKVDTNKYIEYTDTSYQHDVCHNIIQEGNYSFEFDLMSLEDSEARIINEAVDHQPLSEFDHFFQEAPGDPQTPFDRLNDAFNNANDAQNRRNTFDPAENLIQPDDPTRDSGRYTGIRDVPKDRIGNQGEQLLPIPYIPNGTNRVRGTGTGMYYLDTTHNTYSFVPESQLRSFFVDRNIGYAGKSGNEAFEAYKEAVRSAGHLIESELNKTSRGYNNDARSANDTFDRLNTLENSRRQEISSILDRMRYANYEPNSAELALIGNGNEDSGRAMYNAVKRSHKMANIDSILGSANRAVSTVNTAANAAYNIATFKNRMNEQKYKTEKLKKDVENYDADRALRKTEVYGKSKTSNIQYVDDSKCVKMNTMKPLLMRVTLSMLNKDDSIQPIEYIIGVKTHNRVVPASILPEVAKYPLKEMDKISRKIKWRAGELKFLKDLVFRIDEKKQTAADSRDPNRKWYRRLYELAHMKGDAPATAVVQGKSIFRAFLKDKQGKGKLMHGFIPNAAIIMSQTDVNNIKQETDIDLLKSSSARKFCGELFLMNLVIIDTDAESIKIMQPDSNNEFDVHSLASVNKQLATLDTAGTKTRDMFKLLG